MARDVDGRGQAPPLPDDCARPRIALLLLGPLLLVAFLLASVLEARAGAPEWLKAAARQPLPAYPDDTEAVLLLDERITTVKDTGEIKTVVRRAFKILRPGGRDRGTVFVYFDNETRLTFLKGWCLPAGEKEYEVKEKDAVESSPFSGAAFTDTRLKMLTVPAADPGNVVGYEYEQKGRPFLLQDWWWFADTIPVRRARYVLELPPSWEYETYWLNHPEQEPQAAGPGRWAWELTDLAAIEEEPVMPAWRAVAGRLEVSFFPPSEGLRGKSHASWKDVGRWAEQLAEPRRQSSPAIAQKVAELTAGAPSLLEKIKALAAFAQRDIRYVAVEIGIGGYQPHAAADVFANRYGDCKDKVTLLATMLREIGVESYYVLAQTRRGVVAPQAPSAYSFNHAILALRLPAEVDATTLHAVREHAELGRLLFFDPTDELTPLGYLPSSLQANHGLLVSEAGGDLVEMPLLAPTTNRLLRVGKLALSATGDLTGQVQEVRWGEPAVSLRGRLLRTPAPERHKVLESFLALFLGGFTLVEPKVENQDDYDATLVVNYRFAAPRYAKSVGNLLLLRPRVLGQKGWALLEEKERQYPVEFGEASLQSDIFEIALPAGFRVDELPPPVEAVTDFAEYRSRVELDGATLRYKRDYVIKSVHVPKERLEELKQFFRQVAADERNQAVLKRE